MNQRNVKAVVKWFNATKGFGFVQLSEGAPDAFLHISVVERTGNRDVAEGATIVCDLMQGSKGLQVAEIHSVEGGDERPGSSGYAHGSGPGGGHGGGQGGGQGATEVIAGKVRFFNTEQASGLVLPDDGGAEIFLSGRALDASGRSAL